MSRTKRVVKSYPFSINTAYGVEEQVWDDSNREYYEQIIQILVKKGFSRKLASMEVAI